MRFTRKKLMIMAVLSIAMFTMMPFSMTQQVSATAGTAGKLDPVVSFYNPGTPYMIKSINLVDGSYYALLIGSNLASANQVWDNFTASGTTHYTLFNVNSFSTETKLSLVLYGAANDSTTGTSLSQVDLGLIQGGDLLSQDWFLGIAFIVVIFFIFVGVIAALVLRKGKKQ